MRLIDADALDDVVQDLNENKDYGITRGEYKLIDAVLFEFPTIEERKTGEWIELDFTEAWQYKCDQCGRLSDFKDNFCPNCGADMRGERNDNN